MSKEEQIKFSIVSDFINRKMFVQRLPCYWRYGANNPRNHEKY